MKTVRLMGHAGSDVELGYKSLNEIEAVEFDDPLLHTAKIIIENNLLTKVDVVNLYEKSRERVSRVFDQASTRPKLLKSKDIMSTISLSVEKSKSPDIPDKSEKKVFEKEYKRLDNKIIWLAHKLCPKRRSSPICKYSDIWRGCRKKGRRLSFNSRLQKIR